MVNFVLIAVCMLAGMLFRRAKTLPADAHKGINAWIIYIALPAVSFKYLPYIHFTHELFIPILSPFIVWFGGWLMVKLIANRQKLTKPTQGGLRLTSGLANTSFVGFPLIAAYFGEKYISIAIICDQVTFFILSTMGVAVAIHSSQKQELTAAVILKRVLKFPPFLGCMGALIIPHFIDITPANPLIDKLAATVAPLALFSIGLQLHFEGWRDELKLVSLTLLYKLILAPALVLAVFFLLGYQGIIAKISIFEAAMPTLLTAGVVADDYGLNPKLSNLIIGIGIILSLITTSFWWLILR
ncbi:AEC family transporter [Mucilaginibacter sp. HMF5004]|nr:AEC family transporter [Mucilaginibacter rivuli]MBW4891822.1 AEC family transporter [Mucilaginibacter rivuli]